MFIYEGTRTDNPLTGADDCLLINKTGANSVKGQVVAVSTTTDNAYMACPINSQAPIGICAEADVPEGYPVRIISGGIAEVLFAGNTTRAQSARICNTGDSGAAEGKAFAENNPASTTTHFQEIGHVLESGIGGGLRKVWLHFN